MTGATGFIGKKLLPIIGQDKDELFVVKRKSTDLRGIKEHFSNTTFIDVQDLNNPNKLPTLSNLDFVLHLATCYGRDNESEEDIKYVNFSLGTALLDIALNSECKHFLNMDTSLPASANSYASYKSKFRESAKSKIKEKNINFINMTLENVYGPGDMDSKLIPSLIRSCQQGKQYINLSKGSQRRDFIFIDDAVSAISAVIHNLKFDQLHKYKDIPIASSELFSIREIAETIKSLLKSDIELRFGKERELFEEELRVADTRFISSLGWRPTYTLIEGLREVINQ